MASNRYVERRVQRSLRVIERSTATLADPVRNELLTNIRRYIRDALADLPTAPTRADIRAILSKIEDPGTFLPEYDDELPAFPKRLRSGIRVGAAVLIVLVVALFFSMLAMFLLPARRIESRQEREPTEILREVE